MLDLGETIAVIHNWGCFCPQGDFWLCLETFGLVTTGRGVAADNEWVDTGRL